jgi:hypothetical protein
VVQNSGNNLKNFQGVSWWVFGLKILWHHHMMGFCAYPDEYPKDYKFYLTGLVLKKKSLSWEYNPRTPSIIAS